MEHIRILSQKDEMLPLFPLIQQLTPELHADKFNHYLDEMLKKGYRMAAVNKEEHIVGVAGIWVSTKFYSGRYMEIDSVVIDAEYRSKGIGAMLTNFLIQLAEQEGCTMMMLDAYLPNEKAHTFYERHGFVKKGYHFLKNIQPTQ